MAEEQNLSWKPLVELDPTVKSFTANGKTYRVHHTVSMDRYEAYELLQVEIGLARTFDQFRDGLSEAYQLCNKMAFADLAVHIRDMMVGASLVGEHQTHAVLKMAALFINREGEDLRYIDQSVIDSKIEDWRTEGIAMSFFFGFALRSIPGFFAAYKAATLATSKSSENGNGVQGASTLKSESKP